MWYELLFFWTSAVNLDFFPPALAFYSLRISFCFIHASVLPAKLSLISAGSFHIYTSQIPRQYGLKGGNQLMAVNAECLKVPFQWDKVSGETQVGGREHSFLSSAFKGKRLRFGGNVNVMNWTFESHCAEVWQETLGVRFRKKYSIFLYNTLITPAILQHFTARLSLMYMFSQPSPEDQKETWSLGSGGGMGRNCSDVSSQQSS